MAVTAPLLKDCFDSMDDAMRPIQMATRKALMSSTNKRSLTAFRKKDPIETLRKTSDESLNRIAKFKKTKCKAHKGDEVLTLKALTVAHNKMDDDLLKVSIHFNPLKPLKRGTYYIYECVNGKRKDECLDTIRIKKTDTNHDHEATIDLIEFMEDSSLRYIRAKRRKQ
eukprot:10937_1